LLSKGLLVSKFSGVTVVSFRDRSILDGAVVDRLAEKLFRLVDEHARRMILLDFREVRFLSSTMMGVLLALHRKASDIRGKVVISGLNPTVMQAFKIMRLDAVLTIADSARSGMSSFHDVGNLVHQA
jgi:anti-sigma B factor antagonist